MASGKGDYGLILPNKKFNINEVKRPSVFNEDSDSDENAKEMGTSDWIKKSFQKQAAQSAGIRKQTEIDMKKAIEQDPTVYKYDEIYDEMEKKKQEEVKKTKDERKKPRYIQALLKKAELRKIENERRIERQVQKEREAEGEEFKDKETFVTSSYRKKLEEFSKLDEEEKRQDMLEEICDVTKQQDLGGFYRHLYNTTVDKDSSKSQDVEKPIIKKEVSESVAQDRNEKSDLNTDNKVKREKRQYRKRKSSESSSLEEGERDPDDSDTSISSSSSESSSDSSAGSKNSSKTKEKSSKRHGKDDENVQPSKAKQIKLEEKDDEKVKEVEKLDKEEKVIDTKNDNLPVDKSDKDENNEKASSVKTKVEKINIWEKRTVGPVFEAALRRYFQRKAERQAMHGY